MDLEKAHDSLSLSFFLDYLMERFGLDDSWWSWICAYVFYGNLSLLINECSTEGYFVFFPLYGSIRVFFYHPSQFWFSQQAFILVTMTHQRQQITWHINEKMGLRTKTKVNNICNGCLKRLVISWGTKTRKGQIR